MTKLEIKAKYDRMATDIQGAFCGACGQEWRIWYQGARVIARGRCECERRAEGK